MKANTWKITRILTCPDRAGHEVHFDFNEHPYKVLITDQVDLVQSLARLLAGEFELHSHPGLGGWVELVSIPQYENTNEYRVLTHEEKVAAIARAASKAAKPIDPLKIAKALIEEAERERGHERVVLLQEARQWLALSKETQP